MNFVELTATNEYSRTGMAQHMKLKHKPQDRRTQKEWKAWHESHWPGCYPCEAE